MQKVYYLSSCSTCSRILKELNLPDSVELQDIKTENIDAETLDFLKERTGSYESLFSKRAMKYKSLGLNEQTLSEDDYRNWMLKEYTFLKRPFIINGNEVFIGNSAKTVAAAKSSFEG